MGLALAMLGWVVAPALLRFAALPPGGAPFSSTILPQPVPGAPRGATPDAWLQGRLCDVSRAPYVPT